MIKIKIGSMVKVITGDDKGKQGLVKSICLKKNKVRVEGVGLCIRHQKAQKEGEKSTRKIFERFIDISNIVLVSTI